MRKIKIKIKIFQKKKLATHNKNLALYKENLNKIIEFHGTLFKVMDKILPELKNKYKKNNSDKLIKQYDLILSYSSLEHADQNYKNIYNAVKEQVKNYLKGNTITEINLDLFENTFGLIMNFIKPTTA